MTKLTKAHHAAGLYFWVLFTRDDNRRQTWIRFESYQDAIRFERAVKNFTDVTVAQTDAYGVATRHQVRDYIFVPVIHYNDDDFDIFIHALLNFLNPECKNPTLKEQL